MTLTDAQKLFEQASMRHRAGSFDEARALYHQVLVQKPDHADTLHMLGVLAGQAGDAGAATEFFRRAIAANPGIASYHANLGLALMSLLKLDEAAAAFRKVLALRPEHADPHFHLANILAQQGEYESAIASYRQAVALRPAFPEALDNLGQALHHVGQLDPAIATYKQALELRPAYAEAHNNLGNALTDARQSEAAISAFRQAITHRPNYTEAYNNLGISLNDIGRLDDAEAAFNKAISLRPDFAVAHNNLANIHKERGELDAAIAGYERAVALSASPRIDSNRLYTLHFRDDTDAHTIWEAHKRWNDTYARPLKSSIAPHTNDRTRMRRLRVGYVSPDFREHVIGRFLEPLFANHDHKAVEVFCYSDVRRPDAITARLRAHADVWRNSAGLSDEQLAGLIRSDHIDILVDVTMHMEGNRLLAFARKPAPVQATYLAYCATTGLEAMDYRLTDPYLDPPGSDQSIYSERPAYLPQTYWCYQPPAQAPPIGPAPALSAGHITFGCFNNYCKVTPATLNAWRNLLGEVANSRLIVYSPEGNHRDCVRQFFAAGAVDPARVSFVGRVPSPRYFEQYNQIDIALDPFPYTGGTTTCDALWMGVPIVSLAGQTAVTRGGLSILTNAGLPELVAENVADYVTIATKLAKDLDWRGSFRAAMRDKLATSPLMNAPKFARYVEVTYRRMWNSWCGGRR